MKSASSTEGNHMRLDTNAEKAAALLLQWVEEGEPGFPNQDTLDDAVKFARLAQKDRDREVAAHEQQEG